MSTKTDCNCNCHKENKCEKINGNTLNKVGTKPTLPDALKIIQYIIEAVVLPSTFKRLGIAKKTVIKKEKSPATVSDKNPLNQAKMIPAAARPTNKEPKSNVNVKVTKNFDKSKTLEPKTRSIFVKSTRNGKLIKEKPEEPFQKNQSTMTEDFNKTVPKTTPLTGRAIDVSSKKVNRSTREASATNKMRYESARCIDSKGEAMSKNKLLSAKRKITSNGRSSIGDKRKINLPFMQDRDDVIEEIVKPSIDNNQSLVRSLIDGGDGDLCISEIIIKFSKT